MFAAVVLLYHLRIHVVRADAAYFNYAFLGFVRLALFLKATRVSTASRVSLSRTISCSHQPGLASVVPTLALAQLWSRIG